MTVNLLKTVSESKNNFTTHIWFGSVLRRVFQIHSSFYAVVFNIISCSSRNSFKNIVIEGIRWGVMILLVFFKISPIFSFYFFFMITNSKKADREFILIFFEGLATFVNSFIQVCIYVVNVIVK